MQLPRRLLFALALAAASAAHAGGTVVVSGPGASGVWLMLAIWSGLQPPPAPPEVSPLHIRADPAHVPARDSCTFVAGVRHCPLPALRPALRDGAR